MDRGGRGGQWRGRGNRGGGDGGQGRGQHGGHRGGGGGGGRGGQSHDNRGQQFPEGQQRQQGERWEGRGGGQQGYGDGGRGRGQGQGGRGRGGRGDGREGGWGGDRRGDNRPSGYQSGGHCGEGGRGRGQGYRGGRGGRGGGGGGGGGGWVDRRADDERSTTSSGRSDSPPRRSKEEDLAEALSFMKLSPPPNANTTEGKWIIPFSEKKQKGLKEIGTRGRKIMLEVNHLKIELKDYPKVIHYDCAFEPEKMSKRVTRQVMNEVIRLRFKGHHPAFDSRKNLFSRADKPLFKENELTVTVELPGERAPKIDEDGKEKPDIFTAKVTMKPVQTVDMTLIRQFLQVGGEVPQMAVQVLDIVLRNSAAMTCTPVGRSFFPNPGPNERPFSLGNGMDLRNGFYQSAILGWQPYLNIDVAHKGFPMATPLTQVMMDFMKRFGRDAPPVTENNLYEGLSRYQQEDFSKFIKGLKLQFELPGRSNTRRKYTAVGTQEPCGTKKFNFNGRMVTVEQYFMTEKKYKLRFPNLPSIHVGDPKKDTVLPAELCTIVANQVVMRKLDTNQTKNMIRAAAKPPAERKDKITDSIRKINFNKDDCIKHFGISISDQFAKVPAHILDPPSIEYNGSKVKPSDGQWTRGTFKEVMIVKRWAIASVTSRVDQRQLGFISDKIKQSGNKQGMNFADPLAVDVLCDSRNRNGMSSHELQSVLQEAFKRYKSQQAELVVVLIPNKTEFYCKVKVVAEVEVGLVTQCIRDTNKMDPASIDNIILKINTKLNGINHTIIGNNCRKSILDILDGAMLMGADVTHPSPDQTRIPSVAAVTASHDRMAFKYNMCWRLQSPRLEIIQDMRNIVRTQLKFYRAKNGCPPKKIIFYRDGVSEGQFSQVLHAEMTAIYWACLDELKMEIPVTFMVVQKRHHTRFFPTNPKDADRKGNVLAGTVVDTDITHPREVDFYMVSHASLQGTSRPTKYHKLWDANNIKEDDLEELTFYLCHMFSRCTRSVSYPVPTYYAHLAAFRGRNYLEGARIDLDNLAEEMRKRTIQATIVDNSPMFFT